MSCCAATVMSRPADERVILDVGAKGLTMQSRSTGICAISGLGAYLVSGGEVKEEVLILCRGKLR